MNPRLWRLLGVVLVIAPLQAQQPSRILVTPLPVWPGTAAQQNVSSVQAYFDVKANQIVIYASKGNDASTLSPVRFDVPNGATAKVQFAVESAGAQLRYKYAVAEDVHARQHCGRISLILPRRRLDTQDGNDGPTLAT